MTLTSLARLEKNNQNVQHYCLIVFKNSVVENYFYPEREFNFNGLEDHLKTVISIEIDQLRKAKLSEYDEEIENIYKKYVVNHD